MGQMTILKKCFKCKKSKARHLFYSHPRMDDGLLGKCKECAKKDVRLNYIKNRERYIEFYREREKTAKRKLQKKQHRLNYRLKYPGRARANNLINNAIKYGHIKRMPCEKCGNLKSQAHHSDYRKPFQIKWLCLKHHREEEKRLCQLYIS
jgi:hypothetical protein